MRKDKLAKMKMPEANQDEMLELDEAELDFEDAEMDAEPESEMTDLASLSDDDLVAELEARGFMVEAPESEESTDSESEMGDEMEMEDDEEYMA
jgi:hypothetical protein